MIAHKASLMHQYYYTWAGAFSR